MLFDDLKKYFDKSSYPETLPNDIFVTIRYLSFAKESFFRALDAARYFGRVSPEVIVKYLYSTIPPQRPPWFNVIKSKKQKPEEIVSAIARFYNCSYGHAEEILLIFNRNLINPYQIFGLKKGAKNGKKK